jgi:hypothetical protein
MYKVTSSATLLTLLEWYKLQELHKIDKDANIEMSGKLTNIERNCQVSENNVDNLSRLQGVSVLPLLYK